MITATRLGHHLLACGLLLLPWQPLWAHVSCHIHPPVKEAQDTAQALIGPFDDEDLCEKENRKRLGGLGHCHCSLATPFTGYGEHFPRGTIPQPLPLP